jgi:hypothetical protein
MKPGVCIALSVQVLPTERICSVISILMPIGCKEPKMTIEDLYGQPLVNGAKPKICAEHVRDGKTHQEARYKITIGWRNIYLCDHCLDLLGASAWKALLSARGIQA